MEYKRQSDKDQAGVAGSENGGKTQEAEVCRRTLEAIKGMETDSPLSLEKELSLLIT